MKTYSNKGVNLHFVFVRTLCKIRIFHAILASRNKGVNLLFVFARTLCKIRIFHALLASRNKIFIFGTITALFTILSSANPSISQAESNNLSKGNRHLAVISEEVKQQLELIDAETPPLPNPVQEVRLPKLSPEPISSPSTSLFKKFTNILVVSIVGGVTNQTANILSSVTGFLSEIFTNKSSVPETIIPIKQSSSSSSRNEVAVETNDEDSVEHLVTNTNNTGTQTISNSSLPSPTTYNLQPTT